MKSASICFIGLLLNLNIPGNILELGLFLAKKLSIGPCSAMMIFAVCNLLLKYLPVWHLHTFYTDKYNCKQG